MSNVVNLVLLQRTYFGDWNNDRLKPINNYLRNEGVGYLVSVNDKDVYRLTSEGPVHPWYGGYKFLECEMAIGTMNHLDIEMFVDFLKDRIPWSSEDDGACQLLVTRQFDDKFSLIEIFEG